MREALCREELVKVFMAAGGNNRLEQALRRANVHSLLVKLLGWYIEFNAAFAPGVLALAAAVGSCMPRLRDTAGITRCFALGNNDVAAKILAAAIDEFGDRASDKRPTHLKCADVFIRETMLFFGMEPKELSSLMASNAFAFRVVIDDVGRYYSVSATPGGVMEGIGIHIGSELLAQKEFDVLVRFLYQVFPDLMVFLSKIDLETGLPASYWVTAHAKLEEDHFNNAIEAADLAIAYAQPLFTDNYEKLVLKGFSKFVDLQAKLIQLLGQI